MNYDILRNLIKTLFSDNMLVVLNFLLLFRKKVLEENKWSYGENIDYLYLYEIWVSS